MSAEPTRCKEPRTWGAEPGRETGYDRIRMLCDELERMRSACALRETERDFERVTVAELRLDVHKWIEKCTEARIERENLKRELADVRPVVDAAKEWEAVTGSENRGRLLRSVRDLRARRKS